MGRFRSRGDIDSVAHNKNSGGCLGIQGLSPIARPGGFLARSNSHSVAIRDGCTHIPLTADGAQEDKTILNDGVERPRYDSI
jgi:hypothetical protein